MANTNDGGPAFPHPNNYGSGTNPVELCHPGLSIRDAFAIAVMQGVVSGMMHPDGADAIKKQSRKYRKTPEQIVSILAYSQADAMLKAREVGNE